MPARCKVLYTRATTLGGLLLALIAGQTPASGPAGAAELVHIELGALSALVDRKDWGFEVTGDDRIRLTPMEPGNDDLEPVELVRVKAAAPGACPDLIGAELTEELYRKAETKPATLSGLPATRAEAHTRCRNATPKGVAVCAVAGIDAYLVVSRIETCRRGPGSAFAGESPLDKLLRVLQLAP